MENPVFVHPLLLFFFRAEFLACNRVTTTWANFCSFAEGTSIWEEARRNLSLPSEEAELSSFCSSSAPPNLPTSWPADTHRSTPVAYSSRLEPEEPVSERCTRLCTKPECFSCFFISIYTKDKSTFATNTPYTVVSKATQGQVCCHLLHFWVKVNYAAVTTLSRGRMWMDAERVEYSTAARV